MVFYILIALLLFGLMIAVHEGGHFLAAKLFGVRVNEFSIGMGPRLFSKRRGHTLYSLRAIPMGGFCAMEGEDADTEEPDSFAKQKAWKRLVILASGALMNFLAGLLILLLLLLPRESFHEPVLAELAPDFPQQGQLSLQAGDRILSVNGKKIHVVNDIMLYLSIAKGDTVDLGIERAGQALTLPDYPRPAQSYQTEGKSYHTFGMVFSRVENHPGELLRQTWETALYFARSVWLGFQMLFTGDAGMKDLAGPVGIISMIGETGTQSADIVAGLQNVLYIMAMIGVNLAIVNLLPIPALDGGRIFLLLVGQIVFLFTRHKLNPKHESYIHAVGFLALILLMLFVTFQDVLRIFQ